MFSRPAVALVLTSEAGGSALLAGSEPVTLHGSSEWEQVDLLRASAGAGLGAGASELAAGSLELLAAGVAQGASVVAGAGTTLRWAAGRGFERLGGEGFRELEGNAACSEAGVALLARVGVRAVSGAACAFRYFSEEDVELDASDVGAQAQALGEVVAVLAAAEAAAAAAPVAGAGAAPTLFRLYTSGGAVAEEAGASSSVRASLSAILAAAVAHADAALAAAAGSVQRTSAVVVLATTGVPAGAGALGRRAQANPDDPCIDFGNCTTITATPLPLPAAESLSAASIANFHVALWTAVILVLILLASVCMLLGMQESDPALYMQVAPDPRAAAAAKAR